MIKLQNNKYVVSTLLIFTMLLSACGNSEVAEEIIEEKVVPVVKTLKIEESNYTFEKNYAGKVKANKSVDIRSQGEGIVDEINFAVGDNVRKNQLLVSLDTETESATELRFQNLQTTLNNTRKNYTLTQAVNKANVRDAEIAVGNAEIQLQNAQVALENAKITTNKDISNAQIALQNAETNISLSTNVSQTEVSTAEENLDNFLITSARDLENLKSNIRIDQVGLLEVLRNQLQTVNNIIGEEERNNEVNDRFEGKLAITDQQSLINAKNSYRDARNQLVNLETKYSDTSADTEVLTQEIYKTAQLIKKTIDFTDTVLINTITDIEFSEADLNQLKSQIDNAQTGPEGSTSVITKIEKHQQDIRNQKIDNENQIEILELQIQRAQNALLNTKQIIGDEEPANVKAARKSLETTEANAKSRIDDQESQIRVLEQQIESAKSALERTIANGNSSLHSIKERIDQLNGDIRLARLELEDQKIKAPFQGVITAKNVEFGDEINRGTVIGTVSDIEDLKIVIEVPEEDMPYISLGQKANINSKFSGEIVQISPSADPQNRKFEVKILYNNKKQTLAPETLVDVNIEFKKDKSTLLIPINAVTLKQDTSTVFVVDNNNAKLQNIKTGIVIDNMIEVTEGLENGDEIIISGFTFVEDGQSVNVSNDEKSIKNTEEKDTTNSIDNTNENDEET